MDVELRTDTLVITPEILRLISEIDEFKGKTGMTLHEQYMKHHPQILSEFEDEMPKIWGKKWKANTTIGKLRTVLLHRPGKEFLIQSYHKTCFRKGCYGLVRGDMPDAWILLWECW